jgi:hypothetical protein
MICAKYNIGSEIILDALDCTPMHMDQVEADFDLFVDSYNLGARKVHDLRLMYSGMEIALGTPDDTPM